MSIKQISVFVDDRPGTLAQLAQVLEDNNIDMRAICVADSKDFGIVRLVVDDNESAIAVMEDAGYVCMLTDVLAVEVDNTPGGLCKILKVLGDADVNIDYSYTLDAHAANQACIIARVSDLIRACEALESHGLKCLEITDISAA